MIVVDTNVVSEPVRSQPDPHVLDWLAAHGSEVAMTTITVGELIYGVQRLPDGRRKQGLTAAVEELVAGFGHRILGYDQESARAYASIRATSDAAGRPTSVEDGMIAAIAKVGGAPVATRNVTHFEGLGVEVINPWSPET